MPGTRVNGSFGVPHVVGPGQPHARWRRLSPVRAVRRLARRMPVSRSPHRIQPEPGRPPITERRARQRPHRIGVRDGRRAGDERRRFTIVRIAQPPRPYRTDPARDGAVVVQLRQPPAPITSAAPAHRPRHRRRIRPRQPIRSASSPSRRARPAVIFSRRRRSPAAVAPSM
jgi:hypothetical protein